MDAPSLLKAEPLFIDFRTWSNRPLYCLLLISKCKSTVAIDLPGPRTSTPEDPAQSRKIKDEQIDEGS